MEWEGLSKQWMDAKSGVIPRGDLVFVREDRNGPIKNGQWFSCPCGGNHLAFVPFIAQGMSQSLGNVLTCFPTNQQWLIRDADVAGIIFSEEQSYIKLLEESPKVLAKVVAKRGWSEETKRFLAETHGIDPEVSQEIMDSQGVGCGD